MASSASPREQEKGSSVVFHILLLSKWLDQEMSPALHDDEPCQC